MIRVTDRPATERGSLTTYAIHMMARLLAELEESYRQSAVPITFYGLPEYRRLIDGCLCARVCMHRLQS
jgi:hypothetical protein